MKVKRFEDLLVWQKGQDLAVAVDDTYRDNRDWGLKTRYAGLLYPFPITYQKGLTARMIWILRDF